MDECFYKFSDKKFDIQECDLNISGYDIEQIKTIVLNKYTLNDLTNKVLKDVKDMFQDFVLQKGLYDFTLHDNKSVKFYYS